MLGRGRPCGAPRRFIVVVRSIVASVGAGVPACTPSGRKNSFEPVSAVKVFNVKAFMKNHFTPGCTHSAISPRTQCRRRSYAWVPLAIFLLTICSTTAIYSSGSSATLETTLTGKFVAKVDGPPLTGFGLNHEWYVFEMYSPVGSLFVTLSDTFLIYQPHLPDGALDYSKIYKVTAVGNDKCADTLENISRRFLFDSHGQFVEMKYALSYAKNLPSLTLPWKTPLPCYVVSPVRPGAKVAIESTP
jgi:hypothetical protein